MVSGIETVFALEISNFSWLYLPVEISIRNSTLGYLTYPHSNLSIDKKLGFLPVGFELGGASRAASKGVSSNCFVLEI